MQPRREKKSFMKIFAENVTVKGLPKIASSKTMCQRLLWFFAVFLGSTVAGYQVIMLLSKHLDYNSSFVIKTSSETSQFPDITVCNLNPLYVTEYYQSDTVTIEEFSWDLSWRLLHLLQTERFDLIHMLRQIYNVGGYFQNINVTEVMENFRDASTFVSDCIYLQLASSDSFNDVFYECRQTLKVIFLPKYGPCVTFHTNIDNKNARDLEIPIKLTAMLFLNNFQEEVLSTFFVSPWGTFSSGARVMVHPRDTFPNVDKGANIASGNEVTVRLQAKRQKRLGHPYTECTTEQVISTQDYNYTYSSYTCEQLCIQEKVLVECGCLSFEHIVLPEQIKRNDFCGKITTRMKETIDLLVFYSVFNNKDYFNASLLEDEVYSSLNCTLRAIKKVLKNHLCTCLPPCDETSYTSQVFQAPWPHETFHMSFFGQLFLTWPDLIETFNKFYFEALHLQNTDRTKLYEYLRSQDIIKRNFLQLNIELIPNNTQVITEVSMSTLDSLFGTIGGLLNLWVGVTFVTFIELVDVIYILFLIQKNRVTVPQQLVRSIHRRENSEQHRDPISIMHM